MIKALCYADIFNFPLTVEEIVRFSPDMPVTIDEAEERLNSDEALSGTVKRDGNYYFLDGGGGNCQLRMDRETESRQQLEIALRRLIPLQGIPFIRGAAVTGALAALNSPAGDDVDLLIISSRGRTWTAYFFLRLWRRFSHNPDICFNVFISESDLVFRNQNLFYAREILGALPILKNDAYGRFIDANRWIFNIFPSWSPSKDRQRYRLPVSPQWRRRQRQIERMLTGPVGDFFEYCVHRIQEKHLISSATETSMRMRRNRIKLHKRDNRSPILDKYEQRIQTWIGKYRELSGQPPFRPVD
ncbi:MAG: hypothetical protein Q7K29_00090 [Thermoleophilia bacterium]|nr:hypothetical protein [Thermoleophilia bacterium]